MRPLNRGLWVGYFKAVSDQYGDAPESAYSQTCTVTETRAEAARSPHPVVLAPPPGGGAYVLPVGKPLAMFVEAGTPDRLSALCRNPDTIVAAHTMPVPVPLLGIADGFWPTTTIPGVEVLGLEVYARTPTEPVGAIADRVQHCLDELPMTQAIAIIPQCYTREVPDDSVWSHGYQGDRVGLVQAAVDIVAGDPRVLFVLAFSWRRFGGVQYHPELRGPIDDLLHASQIPGTWRPGMTNVAIQPPLPTGVYLECPKAGEGVTIRRSGTNKICTILHPNGLPASVKTVVRMDNLNLTVEHQDAVSGHVWAQTGARRPVTI